MKLIRLATPPLLPVVRRDTWGIGNALVTITLSCGHDYSGLVSDGWAAHNAYPCSRCVDRLVPDHWKAGDLEQLKLFASTGAA